MKQKRGGNEGTLGRRFRRIYTTARAKVVKLRYGNPTGSVRLIAVVGRYGKTTTARLILELLKESGRRVSFFSGEDAKNYQADLGGTLQRLLKQEKQANLDFFILEVT